MYRILIVDDERIIREGIGETFSQTGRYAVSYAENGMAALELCRRERFDAMVIDVVMPGMNGLELLKRLSDEGNEAVKVMLSAHDDYEFVREAMANSAEDYLLKPFYPRDVERLAEKLAEAVESRRQEREEYNRLLTTVEESRGIIQERFFESLLSGWVSEEDFERWSRLLGFDVRRLHCRVLMIMPVLKQREGRGDPEEYQTRLTSRNLTVERVAKRFPECLFHRAGAEAFTLLLGAADEDRLETATEALFAELRDAFFDADTVLCGGAGGVVSDIFRIRRSGQDALTALRHNLAFCRQGVLSIYDLQGVKQESGWSLDDESLVSNLKLGNRPAVLAMFDEIDALLRKGEQDPVYMELALSRLLLTAQLALLEIDPDRSRDEAHRFTADLRELEGIVSLEERAARVRTMTLDIVNRIESSRNDSNSKVVEKAKRFVQERYALDLSLGDVAESVCLSKNYLGQLFKKQTGISIVEYIHRIRISKAKELMDTTEMKIFEVAEAVGYADQHYFSSVFKRFSGISPSDYRQFQ